MPKTVDHDRRRDHIVRAMVDVATRDGLHAVTMRSVAEAAGVSLRLVQYYFGTKAGLMHAGLRHLERRSRQRWADRVARLPRPVSARDFVAAFLDEALPSDADSRAFHLLGASYAVLAMTDRELAEQPFVAGLHHLERELADVLRGARADGDLPGTADPDTEAARLVAVNHGIGTTVVLGVRTAAEARAVLTYHLDRLFTAADRER